MALNFSHRPIFPAHLTEDNLVAPMRIANGYIVEGIPEKNGDGFAKNWNSNLEMDDCFDYGRDRACNSCGSQESVSNDILDLLPSDPFDMDISSTFTAAITGWLEDLEVVDYGGYRRDGVGTSDGNCQLFAELNIFWKKAMEFQAFPEKMGFEYKTNVACRSTGFFQKDAVGDAYFCGDIRSASNVNDVLGFQNGNVGDGDQRCEGLQEGYGIHYDADGGAPHPALFFALSYLGVRDLLVVEKVSRSLCSTVRSDPLLWRSIHIDQSLKEKITDDVLLQLTNRAQGNLQCLSLVECLKITDDGLKRVLESNPRLTKLSVSGCTRLSIEGIVNGLKAFKSMGTEGLKHLRIGGLYGVTQKHFEELNFLLGTDYPVRQNAHRPHFYSGANIYLSCEDDCAIDIEMCPRCQNLRLVYDCPLEGCQGAGHASQVCRACSLCIPRCVQCGRCVIDGEYEETFCLELLCSDCGKQLVKCPERQVRRIGATKSPVSHEPNCGLSHYG